MTLAELLPKLHYPTRLEKLVDGWVHGVALVLLGLAVSVGLGLAIWQGGLGMAGAVAIYAACVITMWGCSMAYNMVEDQKRKAFLRRFDHAAIFLMIAGTYTPFTAIAFDGALSLGMTALVWTLALAGVLGKLFLPNVSKKIWIALYVALGWLDRGGDGAADRREAAGGGDPAADRGDHLYAGRTVLRVGAPALPPRHLARLRDGGGGRALRGGADGRGVCVRLQALRTNSDFNPIWPKPSILQSMS